MGLKTLKTLFFSWYIIERIKVLNTIRFISIHSY